MRINPKKSIIKIKVLPKILARHSFATFFIFLLLDFLLTGIIFYKYVILIEKTKVEILKTPLKFDNASYQEVLNQWQKREESLKKINNKQYINPFQETRELFSTSGGEINYNENISTGSQELATSTPEEPTSSEELPGITKATTSGGVSDSFQELKTKLLSAGNIFDFYRIKKEKFPSISEREIIWEERGLGKKDDYYGSVYQNMLLLQSLKKELIQ